MAEIYSKDDLNNLSQTITRMCENTSNVIFGGEESITVSVLSQQMKVLEDYL